MLLDIGDSGTLVDINWETENLRSAGTAVGVDGAEVNADEARSATNLPQEATFRNLLGLSNRIPVFGLPSGEVDPGPSLPLPLWASASTVLDLPRFGGEGNTGVAGQRGVLGSDAAEMLEFVPGDRMGGETSPLKRGWEEERNCESEGRGEEEMR